MYIKSDEIYHIASRFFRHSDYIVHEVDNRVFVFRVEDGNYYEWGGVRSYIGCEITSECVDLDKLTICDLGKELGVVFGNDGTAHYMAPADYKKYLKKIKETTIENVKSNNIYFLKTSKN